MSLTTRELNQLRQFVSIAQKLLASIDGKPAKVAKAVRPRVKASQPRTRRTGKELARFRKMLLSERRRGVPVAEIASNHGISAAYIYQLK